MTWADWFLIAALVISVLIGVLRGFTREVLGLVSWIVAIAAALYLAPSTVHYLEDRIATPSLRIAASYAVVFFGVLVLGAIVTSIASMLVRKSPLSGVDRMIGGGFGLIRGVLIAVVLVWLAGMTPARQDAWWKSSMFIPKVEVLAEGFRSLMPEEWRKRLAPSGEPAKKEGV